MSFETIVKIFSHKEELETTTKNVTTLGGRIALQKIFRGVNSFQPNIHYTLSEALLTQKGDQFSGNPEYFINPSDQEAPDTQDIEEHLSRKVEYFCIGTGGIIPTPLEIAKARNHETRLYNMVPFRCVPVNEGLGDLSSEERSKYAMRRKEYIGDKWYYTYYLKKFSIDNIVVEKADGTPYVIDYNDSAAIMSDTSDHPLLNTAIHVHYDFMLYIEPEDFKEYYKAVNGGQLDLGARLTEFGLVLANEKEVTVDNTTYDELYNVELFSKVAHAPSPMDQEENAKRITYSIFS